MLNPNWHGVAAALLAIVAFFISYRMGVKRPIRQRILLGLAASVLALPGLALAAYYTKLLPEAAWYYEFRSFPGTEYLMILVGIAGGIVASALHRMLLPFPLFAVFAISIIPTLKPFLGPLPETELQEQWKDGACLQSTSSTCGAASTATVLASYGVKVTETQLAREAHSYAGGTEAWYLARAVRSRGLDARFQFSEGFDPSITFPAVAGVKLGAIGHFIPILQKDGDHFLIADPLVGKEWMTKAELLRRYKFTGFYMPISQKR